MSKTRLTDIAVEKLKPIKKDRTELQDAVVPALWLRITEKNHKSWAVSYRYNGKQKKLTIGSYPAYRVAEARDAAREAMRLIAQGEDPAYLKKEKIIENKVYTFATVAEEFIERYAKPKNRTWESAKRYLEAHAIPVWGEMPISNIKRRDVIALMDKVLDRGFPHTANHVFSVLRKLFNWAAERNIIEASPCTYLKMPAEAIQRDRVLSDNEIRLIWQECEAQAFPFGHLVQILLLTGQRLREVSCMRWQEIDFLEKLWRIPRERVKANRSHEIPLSSLALEIIENLPRFAPENNKEDDGKNYVFTTTAGKVPFSGFSKAKVKLDDNSGISNWRLHDLRRTCGTNLAKIGVPVSTISQVLNHAQGGVTAIYNRHSYLPEKQEALEKWAHRIKEIMNA